MSLAQKLDQMQEDVALMTAAALVFANTHWEQFATETGLGDDNKWSQKNGYYHTLVRALAMSKTEQALAYNSQKPSTSSRATGLACSRTYKPSR